MNASPLDYPVCLRLAGRAVTVVGAGPVALSRVRGLLEVGAVVTVVAPHVHTEILGLNAEGRIDVVQRAFVPADLDGATLAFSAVDDDDVTAAVADAARARGVWLNAADVPVFCDVTLPAVARRGPVTLAVSSGGQAPALSRRLKETLARSLPAHPERMARVVRLLRARLEKGPARMAFIREIVDGDIGSALLDGDRAARRKAFIALRAALSGDASRDAVAPQHTCAPRPPREGRSVIGTVALVGAGPGDPELLTLRAVRRLASCDVVVTDALVHPAVLELVPPHIERVVVGKRAGDEGSARQEDINVLLVSLARAGKHVVRLKGGDPFVFGRGGEEAIALARAGVPFEVVPGLTAGTAVTALAHIPVTHRGRARSVAFVTATTRADDEGQSTQALVATAGIDTVVVYMGGRRAGAVADVLMAAGKDKDTPCAAIVAGSYEHEHVVIATLATLAQAVAQIAGARAPMLLVIGEVVRVREEVIALARAAHATNEPLSAAEAP